MNPTLPFHWEIVSGGGSIAPISPFSPFAVYTPPILEPNETERSVTLRCTITDLSLDLLRRDLFGTQITRTFRIVNRPTVHVSVAAVDPEGNLLSTTPIPSGQNLASRLRFMAGKRGTAWNMDSVTFTTPWVSVTILNPSAEPVISFTTEPICRDEPHWRFQFGASAVFSITVPPPFSWRIERQDEKTAERLLGFDIYYLPPYDRSYTNELIDDSRGQSVLGTGDVPNWFHHRAGHWGNVIPRFNEQYTYGGVSYPIVHWIPLTLEEILEEVEEPEAELLRGVWDGLYRWWTGQQGSIPTSGLPDPEMYSRLYGEWNHYWIGSLDSQDWSVGGRQDDEGGN